MKVWVITWFLFITFVSITSVSNKLKAKALKEEIHSLVERTLAAKSALSQISYPFQNRIEPGMSKPRKKYGSVLRKNIIKGGLIASFVVPWAVGVLVELADYYNRNEFFSL